MRKVETIIERSTDGICTIYCENEIFSGVGKSPDEAKFNLFWWIFEYFREEALRKRGF